MRADAVPIFALFASSLDLIEPERIRELNRAEPRSGGRYILYWAQAGRRAGSNHALAYAAELANLHQLPLLFYEGLTCTYPGANDRLHTFILEGVLENARRVRKLGAGYIFHLHRHRRDPHDALYRVAKNAAALVTDDYPSFVPRVYN